MNAALARDLQAAIHVFQALVRPRRHRHVIAGCHGVPGRLSQRARIVLHLRAQRPDQQVGPRQVADPPRVVQQQMVADFRVQLTIAAVENQVQHPLFPVRHVAMRGVAIHQAEEHAARYVRFDCRIGQLRGRAHQLAHFCDPVVERLEVVPLEHQAVDDGAPAAASAEQIAVGFEALISLFEMASRLRRVERPAADTLPVQQPWIRSPLALRQTVQPALDDLVAPLVHECRSVRDDESRQRVRIAGCAQQLGCFFDLVVRFEQRCCFLAQGRQLGGIEHLRRARQQKVAKQRVVLVDGLVARMPQREVVALVQILQQLARMRAVRQLDHGVQRHLSEQRGHREDALLRRTQGCVDLAGEVVEQHLMTRAGERCFRIGELALLQQQDESTGPALRLFVQHLGRGAQLAVGANQRVHVLDFVERQPQLLPAQQHELIVDAHARERGRRTGATEHNDHEAARQRCDAVTQGSVQLGVRGYLVIVVEHQHERRLHTCREHFEVATSECRASAEFRGQVRQSGPLVAGRVTHREAEVMKERGQIAVALVQAIPQVRQILRFEIAAGERSLAGARRPAHPDDRLVPIVQQLDQPGPPQNPRVVRTRDLCGNRVRRHFVQHRPQRSSHTIGRASADQPVAGLTFVG